MTEQGKGMGMQWCGRVPKISLNCLEPPVEAKETYGDEERRRGALTAHLSKMESNIVGSSIFHTCLIHTFKLLCTLIIIISSQA